MHIYHRITDPKLSLAGFPVQRMEEYNPVGEGEIFEATLVCTPISMKFPQGKKLRVKGCGIDLNAFPPIDQATLEVGRVENANEQGVVTLHCGRKDNSGSYILLPVVDLDEDPLLYIPFEQS